MFEHVITALDWFGLLVFAITGTLVASRKEMDIVGFVLLATVTGVGGGTLRDVLLGNTPVFWILQPGYLLACAAVACVMFFAAHIPQSRIKLLLWLDAVGLSLFTVTGAERALNSDAGYVVAIGMGVITATFGGIIRDLLGGEEPVIRRPEIYVTAAFIGAVMFVVSVWAGVPDTGALMIGFFGALLIRTLALYHRWSLPRYKVRPGR